MKGDFSRLTFDPSKQFTRVLMQQGRVQLDADWNEQSAILLHYLQALAADLIGPFGVPAGNDGFKITPKKEGGKVTELEIGYGRYYVDGLLCERIGAPLKTSPGSNPSTDIEPDDNPNNLRSIPSLGGQRLRVDIPRLPALVYLDVWEHHVTYVEDDSIREVALGGPDTATRAQVVWQVKWTDKMPDGTTSIGNLERNRIWEKWQEWVNVWQPLNRGKLMAQAKKGRDDTNPCTAAPGARYRGAENQLYRVEIHRGGQAGEATFKWSRDNGAVIFAVRRMAGDTVFLEHLGLDERTGLKPGDWVELLDKGRELRDETGILLQVEATDARQASVRLKLPQGVKIDLPEYSEAGAAEQHPYLRRWDYREGSPSQGIPNLVEGALALTEGNTDTSWLSLEDGVQIRFEPGGTYRPGDYWLIPARTATGGVEWPPEAQPPHGVHHRYAPLALLKEDNTAGVAVEDLRRSFKRLVTL